MSSLTDLAFRLEDAMTELDMGNDLEPKHRQVLERAVEALGDAVTRSAHQVLLDHALAARDEMYAEDLAARTEDIEVLKVSLETLRKDRNETQQKYVTQNRELHILYSRVTRFEKIARDADQAMKNAQQELHRYTQQDAINSLRPWSD